MHETDIYQQARVKARRTITFRLRRQEQQILDRARMRQPTGNDLARLAAIRSEMNARRAGHRRAQSFLGLWTP